MVPSDKALATSYRLSIVTMSHLQRFGGYFQWKVSSYKGPYLGNGEK